MLFEVETHRHPMLAIHKSHTQLVTPLYTLHRRLVGYNTLSSWIAPTSLTS